LKADGNRVSDKFRAGRGGTGAGSARKEHPCHSTSKDTSFPQWGLGGGFVVFVFCVLWGVATKGKEPLERSADDPLCNHFIQKERLQHPPEGEGTR